MTTDQPTTDQSPPKPLAGVSYSALLLEVAESRLEHEASCALGIGPDRKCDCRLTVLQPALRALAVELQKIEQSLPAIAIMENRQIECVEYCINLAAGYQP